MIGVPVIINHKSINDDNADDERVGVVSDVWFDEKDGWYWCDGVIWDETAQNLITDQGWSVSCSYDVLKADDDGGSENNIPYDMEFLDGVFTHLALVNNPRYERANIVFNSKTVISNGWISKKDKNGEVYHVNLDGYNDDKDKQDKKETKTKKQTIQIKNKHKVPYRQFKELEWNKRVFGLWKGEYDSETKEIEVSYIEMSEEEYLKVGKDILDNVHDVQKIKEVTKKTYNDVKKSVEEYFKEGNSFGEKSYKPKSWIFFQDMQRKISDITADIIVNSPLALYSIEYNKKERKKQYNADIMENYEWLTKRSAKFEKLVRKAAEEEAEKANWDFFYKANNSKEQAEAFTDVFYQALAEVIVENCLGE